MKNQNNSMFEQLENRRLLAASISNGVLSVVGSIGNDEINIALSETDQTQLVVNMNGTPSQFNVSDITSVSVFAGLGDDRIDIDSDVPFRFFIKCGGGDDYVEGGAHNDTVYGGDGRGFLAPYLGDDLLIGGDGLDLLSGASGDDTIFGGDGNDGITGGFGRDYIKAGAGDDRISGNHGDDSIFGGDGNDVIWGNLGNDLMIGGSGNDCLSGGEDNDTMIGGLGDDDLHGGQGRDEVSGNLGDDDFLDSHDDVLDGGDGDSGDNALNEEAWIDTSGMLNH